MDLCLDVENYKLNIRVAGVLIHNNKVLTHKDVNKDHYALPGGRIQIGENSKEALRREIQEELGKEIEIKQYIATIENFFEMDNKKYHEIFFIHKAEFVNDEDKKIEYIMYNMEGKEYLRYEWLDLEKIDEYNILPHCVNKILNKKDYPLHIINYDINE